MASKPKEAQTQTVTLNGKVYPLRFDYGSLIAFCDQVGATIDTIQEAMAGLSMDRLSLLVWAGVMDWTYESDDDYVGRASLKPEQVAKWLRQLDIGPAQEALAKAMQAFSAAMPPPSDKPGDEGGPPANPEGKAAP